MRETDLGFLEGGIDAGLEVSEITEYAFFELFHVSDWSPKGLERDECEREAKRGRTDLEAEDEGSDDVSAGDVVEAVPEDTADVFLVGEEEAVHAGRGRRVVGVVGGGGMVGGVELVGGSLPSGGSGGEEELELVEMVETLLLEGGEGSGEAVGGDVVGDVVGVVEVVGDLVVELGVAMGVARTCCGLVGVELDGGGDLEDGGWRRIAMMKRHGKRPTLLIPAQFSSHRPLSEQQLINSYITMRSDFYKKELRALQCYIF
jgi:hypothetical protein